MDLHRQSEQSLDETWLKNSLAVVFTRGVPGAQTNRVLVLPCDPKELRMPKGNIAPTGQPA
jgi:hypothetical protein